MSLIKIENLTFLYFGYSNDIFNKLYINLDTNWRTGLIGRNGIGKSTLFKLLLNEEKYQSSIDMNVNCITFPPNSLDYFKNTIELFYLFCPNHAEWELLKELNLMSIDISILSRPFISLSSGEQTKILLAVLFVKEDGFLLIDEPTNHLDLIGRKIVSDYLKNKKGFLLISHDRYFLDSCIDHVLPINKNSVDIQAGNFTSWYENKLKKEQFESAENNKLKRDIKRLKQSAQQTEQWSNKIEKTKYCSSVLESKPDKGYIGHKSAKMMKKSKNLERRINKALDNKSKLLKDIDIKEDLKLHTLNYHKNTLIHVANLSSFYRDKQILKNLSFELKQGERLHINGGNGSGKSTLLKILLGEQISYTGDVEISPNLEIAYVPQCALHLLGSLNNFIDSQDVDETLCKTILRKLNFSRELFDLDMQNYSDGQKKKVLIATSLSKKPMCLFGMSL